MRLLVLVMSIAALSLAACNRKSGCPAQDNLKPNVNRKGELKASKSGSSQLFSKKTNKKLRGR
ncbi:MAG: hypothetical protein ACK4NS_05035 [Saprospiraceae bacterium]